MTILKKPRQVICPTCHKPVAWVPDNIFRPFCSERCKMIDLGVWANEGYSVPCDEDNPFSEDSSPAPNSHLQ